jgi:hypothetical protein
MRARFTAITVLALLAAAVLLVAPTAALADSTTTDQAATSIANGTADGALTGSCPDAPTSQTFLPWGDTNLYQLISGGDFENDSSNWSLSGQAQVVNGNEPFFVGSQSDSNSLYLGDTGSATSDTVCLDPNTPSLRFFAQNDGSHRHSWLQVSVNYLDVNGNSQSQVLAYLTAGSSWGPTDSVAVLTNYLANLTGPLDVTFTFTPVGCGVGDWSIDDVYLDPFKTK